MMRFFSIFSQSFEKKKSMTDLEKAAVAFVRSSAAASFQGNQEFRALRQLVLAAEPAAQIPPAVSTIAVQPHPVTVAGFDTTANCAPHVDAIKAVGYKFVCRYSSHSSWKNMTRAEVVALSKAGLYVVNVWESAGDHVSFFNHDQGQKDGEAAYQFARQIGQPFNAPIYFAVDTDAGDGAIKGGIHDYFQGVRQAFQMHGEIGKGSYLVGVYGCGAVCKYLKQIGFVSFTWLAFAPGWSGNKEYKDWNLCQIRNGVKIAGMDCDLDTSRGEGGGFQVLA